MDTEAKIRLLMAQALPDQEGNGSLRELASGERARQALDPINIRGLADRGFGESSLFRILLSNACAFECGYCPMRASRDLPRHALAPAALAEIFMTAHRRGWVSGLFVTTGIPKSPQWAMDRLLELVETVRFRHRYAGYLHAKAVAGAEQAQVERLALLCDRVSFNLESACQATLDRVAPEKRVDEGVAVLRVVRATAMAAGVRRLPGDPRPPGPAVRAGATSQFVVGLGSETDRDLLFATHALWTDRTIHHPHFAAFRPIEDTPLENAPETPVLREQRLYQADFLLRQYGLHRTSSSTRAAETFHSRGTRSSHGLSRTRSASPSKSQLPTERPCCGCRGSGQRPSSGCSLSGGRSQGSSCPASQSSAATPDARQDFCRTAGDASVSRHFRTSSSRRKPSRRRRGGTPFRRGLSGKTRRFPQTRDRRTDPARSANGQRPTANGQRRTASTACGPLTQSSRARGEGAELRLCRGDD